MFQLSAGVRYFREGVPPGLRGGEYQTSAKPLFREFGLHMGMGDRRAVKLPRIVLQLHVDVPHAIEPRDFLTNISDWPER